MCVCVCGVFSYWLHPTNPLMCVKSNFFFIYESYTIYFLYKVHDKNRIRFKDLPKRLMKTDGDAINLPFSQSKRKTREYMTTLKNNKE